MGLVKHTLTDTSGNPTIACPVTIKLISGTTGGFVGTTEVLSQSKVRTDPTGLWSATLTPNADITPADTYYTATQLTETLAFVVPVGAGPFWVKDLLVQAPTMPAGVVVPLPLTDASLLVSGTVADARLPAGANTAAVTAKTTPAAAAAAAADLIAAQVPALIARALVASVLHAGDPFMGGYFVGVMDTTKANIIAADASQVGARYALIVAPLSLDTTQPYKTTNDAAPASASTRWDGLAATAAMAADAATYPAADYCNGLTYPADGGSRWYLPAMDEMELIYRALKPTTEVNYVAGRAAGTFPGLSSPMGQNVSSYPVGAAYTTGSPPQTSVLPFRPGGAQALAAVVGTNVYYWASTEYSASDAWVQFVSGGYAGNQGGTTKDGGFRVRPVRRIVL